ncbi:hypothetical protein ACFCZ1_18565 [Streptomyces sp. NPDC056224]|uniref:hypothetical protein n=1 Tax=Streptomyces sp. NPDC056224 TaxID=3345750 RepID=UPI0035E0CEA7
MTSSTSASGPFAVSGRAGRHFPLVIQAVNGQRRRASPAATTAGQASACVPNSPKTARIETGEALTIAPKPAGLTAQGSG